MSVTLFGRMVAGRINVHVFGTLADALARDPFANAQTLAQTAQELHTARVSEAA